MDYDQTHKWLNGDELIGGRIVSGLEQGHDQFAFEQRDLVGAGVEAADLLARLGPGWSAQPGSRLGETILVRSIPAEQALSQIRQTIGRRTPMTGTVI